MAQKSEFAPLHLFERLCRAPQVLNLGVDRMLQILQHPAMGDVLRVALRAFAERLIYVRN